MLLPLPPAQLRRGRIIDLSELSASLSRDEPCRNGSADRDDVWGQTPLGPRNRVLDGDRIPRGTFTFDVPVRYISAIGAIRGAGLALSPYSVGDRLD